jgi:hypothetical protein
MIAAAHLSMRSRAEHLRRQRDERWLDSRGFLGMQPNPFVDEVGIEAVPKAMFACRHGAEGAWKIRLMGQKWCPLKLGGHHGLRRRCREGVLAGRILLNYVVWGNGSVSARL